MACRPTLARCRGDACRRGWRSLRQARVAAAAAPVVPPLLAPPNTYYSTAGAVCVSGGGGEGGARSRREQPGSEAGGPHAPSAQADAVARPRGTLRHAAGRAPGQPPGRSLRRSPPQPVKTERGACSPPGAARKLTSPTPSDSAAFWLGCRQGARGGGGRGGGGAGAVGLGWHGRCGAATRAMHAVATVGRAARPPAPGQLVTLCQLWDTANPRPPGWMDGSSRHGGKLARPPSSTHHRKLILKVLECYVCGVDACKKQAVSSRGVGWSGRLAAC